MKSFWRRKVDFKVYRFISSRVRAYVAALFLSIALTLFLPKVETNILFLNGTLNILMCVNLVLAYFIEVPVKKKLDSFEGWHKSGMGMYLLLAALLLTILGAFILPGLVGFERILWHILFHLAISAHAAMLPWVILSLGKSESVS